MTSKRLGLAIAMLFAGSAFAQEPARVAAPANTMSMRSAAAQSRMKAGTAPNAQAQLAASQVKELEETIAKMQTLVKAMKAKAVAAKNKAAMDDVQLWELLVSHLDQTLVREKRLAAERAEFMARREALYRQAQVNADMSAARARAAQAVASTNVSNGDSPATQVQTQTAPAQSNNEAQPKN